MALRSSPENPQPLGRIVAEVTGWVGKLGQVWVDAQVIELRRRAGANVHFLKLRDRYAEVSANVICSSEVLDRAGPLIEGSQVVALVKPRIWNKTASLSFECSEIRICGEGQLLAELERRKRQLQAEGLFDLDRKQKLPFLPKAIGLIAGQNSDAERDVRTHIARRWPVANIVFKPALVQGPDAAQTIVKGLAELVENPKVEVIVIARGGGSLEDLLPFSDEGLVRVVANCPVPVVSAIGHEADFPILDLVADLRASTPTDVARHLVPDMEDERQLVERSRQRLRSLIKTRVVNLQQDLSLITSRPALRAPVAAFQAHEEQLKRLKDHLTRAIERRISDEQLRLNQSLASVRAMSPKATLHRGYAILVAEDGATVSKSSQVAKGDLLQAHLATGELTLKVTKTKIP